MSFDLSTLELDRGKHCDMRPGACLMEAVSLFAGEPFSDHPRCASRVVTEFGIRLNDMWSVNDRQLLKPFIPRIVATAGTVEQERVRAFMCADWACRTVAPMALELRGLKDWAEKLRALSPVVDRASAAAAGDLAREARGAAADADAAAYAADAAAAAAADAYAYADKLKATDARIQIRDSALELMDRLISVTEKK